MLNKIIKEPLVHFLIGGFFLFIFYRSCAPSIVSGSDGVIVVTQDDILEMMQYQSKAFNNDLFEERFANLSASEKEQLIRQYIRDEVLYQEALRLGIDQNDYVIKRRVIQKMEFMLNEFEEEDVEIHQDSLVSYYNEHQDRYSLPSQYTFTHIFFKADPLGEYISRAEQFMEDDNHHRLSISQSLQYGDRFLYHRNYTDRSQSFVESQFGNAFAQSLSELQLNKDIWQGPLESKHGAHWVKLISQSESRIRPLEEVTETVRQDYINASKDKVAEERVDKLIERYDVKVEI